MENSYVNLSLEKYNELYDKANAYDEMKAEEAAESFKELLKDIPEALKRAFGTKEETAATEEVVEKVFHVGQKVKLVEHGNYTNGFDIGEIVTIEKLDCNETEEHIKIRNCDGTTGYVSAEQIEAINEGEEN